MTMSTVHNLPAPDPIAKTHSDRLRRVIAAEIAEEGPISFARYMQLALYAPGLGYYSAGSPKWGVEGDFITAAHELFFSQCLARQCQQVLSQLGDDAVLLELGAGSGEMAVTLLRALEEAKTLPAQYLILELSADLRERQYRLFQTQAPHLLPRVQWLDTLAQKKMTGIILANEVMDAMPVHCFIWQQGIKECYVDYVRDQLCWSVGEPSQALLQAAARLNVTLEEGYISEIHGLLPAWIATLSDVLQRGLILLIDYGFPAREYYHPDRRMGTLMCHYRHRAHTDPFWYPGLQDITAHVNFTTVAEAAREHDLHIAGYTHQAGFLLGCGIHTLLPDPSDTVSYYAATQQVKRLTLASEMGELFKVVALTRDYGEDLLGFTLFNQVERL